MIYRTIKVDGLQEMLNSVTKKYQSMVENIRWHIRVNEPDETTTDKLNKQIQEYNGFINDLKLIEEAVKPIPADIKTAEEIKALADNKFPKGYTTSGNAFRNDGFIEGYKQAMQEYASLNRGEDKWISVKDDLPKVTDSRTGPYSETVLAVDTNGRIDMDEYWQDGTWTSNKTITHWQPLPQPPKQ